MNEMFNATTSLFPLLCIKEENGLYINASLAAFSFIATINHFLPTNLSGATHLVKCLLTNILFGVLGLDPVIGITISLLDLTPLYFKNNRLLEIGEKMLQVPRQIIDVYLIYQIAYIQDMKERAIFIIISKVIYFIERRIRIHRKERDNFYFLHCMEHIGMYVLLCSLLDVYIFQIFLFLKIFAVFIITWCVAIAYFSYYMSQNYTERAPEYIRDDEILMNILSEKIKKNLYKGKWFNYICKPWSKHLKNEIVTWDKIENNCKEILSQINIDEIDVIVGISTGGAFIGAYIAKQCNKPYEIINSKLWSGNTLIENTLKTFGFALGKQINPIITGNPDLSNKTILLCDDTTYTGITMNKCKTYCIEKCGAKEVKTMCIWIHGRFIPDYYTKVKRVPIYWEWGAEMD
jgi:hypoxanthine phosphoribosyltransferase